MSAKFSRALNAITKKHGLPTVSKLLGLSEQTIAKLAAGLPVSAATNQKLTARLHELAAQ